MTIQREEAAQALRDAAAAADRSATAVGYQRSSHYLFLWGVVWAVANLAGYFRLPYGGLAWPTLMIAGIAGSVWIGARSGRSESGRNGLKALVVGVAIALFSICAQLITRIGSFPMAEAVACLAVGAAYMVMGMWVGWRLSIVGAFLMIAVTGGWIYAREQFFLWMALVGGGGLVVGGLWLRKA
jgi:hypothetical protein